MKTLIGWLRMDVLHVGPNQTDRSMLYDFIVSEIEDIELRYPEKRRFNKTCVVKAKATITKLCGGGEQQY